MLMLFTAAAHALTCDEVDNLLQLNFTVRVVAETIEQTVNRTALIASCPVAAEIALHPRRARRAQRAGEPIVLDLATVKRPRPTESAAEP